ncbi:MAG TPA: metallophosphoesterase [Candidatus Limnocylindrales bacterium]|nr:metallophosphoesterase [Candidatus Limnocylindrales bacterium]
MIRRVRVEWPDGRPFEDRDGRPIRILAASDERDAALEHESNRAAIAPLDAVVGCGDLDPEWLAFLGDAFRAPLAYVRGNHDRGGGWEEEPFNAPLPLPTGRIVEIAGLPVACLEWPGVRRSGNGRHPGLAWRDVLGIARRALVARLTRGARPLLVISHAPPEGAGDAPADPYHVGFGAYRWLLDSLRPPLWLHGHTTMATVPSLLVHEGPTTLVNVTGAVLVEIMPPGSGDGRGDAEPDATANSSATR